ncbi:MAG: flagellar protein FliS [Lachnospiraceae bacterium]|jgi:flagellar protein FliS|nr:flagellar protein FliS [Lachnospiraceae bacterium]
MTNQTKQDFTLRITQANKTDLIVILYEMTLAYLADAKDAYAARDYKGNRQSLNHARACVNELITSLDFHYEIAVSLLTLYIYLHKEMAKAELEWDESHLDNAVKVAAALHIAWAQIAPQDESAPLMENAETVYTGMTYDRRQALGNYSPVANRGFRV